MKRDFVIVESLLKNNPHLSEKAKRIKLVLTDVDGVLTDTGVYYSPEGEAFKRYSIRDGMGVERLRDILNIETGIITGENSGTVITRAEKLKISVVKLGIKDKLPTLNEVIKEKNISAQNVAYIGDDANDFNLIGNVGLFAAPADAMEFIREKADYVCNERGGNGAFRELAELIIALNAE